MQYSEKIGESLKIQMAVAAIVSRYAQDKKLSRKLTELLKDLLFENLKEDVTDEDMVSMLQEGCEEKRLEPDEVMKHFTAITENLADLLAEDGEDDEGDDDGHGDDLEPGPAPEDE